MTPTRSDRHPARSHRSSPIRMPLSCLCPVHFHWPNQVPEDRRVGVASGRNQACRHCIRRQSGSAGLVIRPGLETGPTSVGAITSPTVSSMIVVPSETSPMYRNPGRAVVVDRLALIEPGFRPGSSAQRPGQTRSWPGPTCKFRTAKMLTDEISPTRSLAIAQELPQTNRVRARGSWAHESRFQPSGACGC